MIALLLCLALQDVDMLVEQLQSDDIHERDEARVALRKLPLEKLTGLEKALDHKDADVRTTVRETMEFVIGNACNPRAALFECAPVADREVMEAWIKDGADAKKPPKGYAVVDAKGYESFDTHTYFWLAGRDTWLVAAPAITTEDVRQASVAPGMAGRWQVSFEMGPAGAKRFDAAAKALFNARPRGMMAIVLQGRMVSAPVVMADSFGGRGEIAGGFTREKAAEVALALRGKGTSFSCRFVPVENASREGLRKVIAARIRNARGVEDGDVVGVAADLSGLEVDLVGLWQDARKNGYRLEAPK